MGYIGRQDLAHEMTMESENAPSTAAAEDAEDLRMLRTAPKLLGLSQNAEEEIGSVIIFPAINRY